MECNRLHFDSPVGVEVLLCRGRLADPHSELIPHFGGEVMEEKEFFGGFVREVWDLQGQVAVQQDGGQGVFEVDGELAAGTVGSALPFLVGPPEYCFDLANQALGTTDGEIGEDRKKSGILAE